MLAPKIWLQKHVNLNGISDQRFAKQMTFAGNKVEAIHHLKGEVVYEFEITSNRPDTLSIIGLAREAAAIFNKKLILPSIPSCLPLKTSPLVLKLADTNLCYTYSAVEINQVKIKPSSRPLQKLLKLAGLRPVNNIVDISNYLLWEYGQPLHTFDADKIKGSLHIRLAKPGETITTLDHKNRQLLGGEIIIEDQQKIIDVPGIMGGLSTEIDSKTKRVYLLVAIDNPILIRRASQALKLRSPSSTRSEKKLDLTQTELVAKHALQLIKQEAGGVQITKLVTLPPNWQPKTIPLSLSKLKKRLGYSFSAQQVNSYLKSIGLRKTSQGWLQPSWRRDLETDIDLIEEVSRLYGYNRLPRTLPGGQIPIHADALKPNWIRILKNRLIALGYSETYSSALISQTMISALNLSTKKHLKVLHPTSHDFEFMRSTILENLYPLIDLNLRFTNQIRLFELALVFHPSGSINKLPCQPLELGLIDTQTTYPRLKGIVEDLALTLGLNLCFDTSRNHPSYHPSFQAKITFKNQPVGYLGQLHHHLKPWALQLNLDLLLDNASQNFTYPKLSSYPPIIEDLTFTLPPKTQLGPLIEHIKSTHSFIKQVSLVKTYQRNFTFHLIYQSLTQPLSDPLIAPIRKKIVSRLNKKYQAKLIGQLK